MRIENSLDAALGATVHLVGRLSPAVLSFLRPVTSAISATGARQVVIFVDDEFSRQHVSEISPNVDRIRVPDHGAFWGRGRNLYRQLVRVAQQIPIASLHLHGVTPALFSAPVLRQMRLSDANVVFYPHSSRALTGFAPLRAAALGALRLSLWRSQNHAVASTPADARLIQSLSNTSAVEVFESSVNDIFFDTPRNEARRPLLISGGPGELPAAAAGLTQLAVLMGDDDLNLSFNWVGPANANTLAAFKVADIGQFNGVEPAERARRFSVAWIYVAAVEERGFPVGLVEAMASGLPCVAINSDNHRHVLRHGDAGFLCANTMELAHHIAQLVDTPELRKQMGHAARLEAQARFSDVAFSDRLLLSPELSRELCLDTVPSALAA